MKRVMITGAAGFIGNAACQRYRECYDVVAVDDLSRPTARIPQGVTFLQTDARKVPQLGLGRFDVVLHLAAQVSVVASLKDPAADFHNNAELGFALAQWARETGVGTFIYANTNKVYGELPGVECPVLDTQPLNPQTPYGISKAVAGMYVRELLPYAGYDFRQSCIYGEAQVGTEDQGWIGYLARTIRACEPVICYGDGDQVRDLLHVEDLLDAYALAIRGAISPGSYAVGGGCSNAVTFKGAVTLLGGTIYRHEPWRAHDQRYFAAASDGLRKAGWQPKVDALSWLSLTGKRTVAA